MTIESGLLSTYLARGCTSVLCSALLVLIGADWLAYEILFVLVTIDIITGFINACRTNSVSSYRFFSKWKDLLIYFLLIIAAHQIVRYQGFMVWIETSLVLFLATRELLSIIENVAGAGVPIPSWVTKRLEKTMKEMQK